MARPDLTFGDIAGKLHMLSNLETIPHLRGFAPMVMTANPPIGLIVGGLTDTGRVRWHD
jgi:hypothetical protein